MSGVSASAGVGSSLASGSAGGGGPPAAAALRRIVPRHVPPSRAGGAALPCRDRRGSRRAVARSGRARPFAERLDRDLGHRPGRIRRRERPLVEPLRGAEQAGRGDDVGVPGPTRQRIEADVRARPGAGRQASARRDQLHDRGGIVVGVGEPSADQPVAGGRPTEHGRDDRLRPGVDELDDPAVAGHRRLDGLERTGDGGRLPAPRHAQGAAGERVERQQRRPPRDRAPRTCRGTHPSRSRLGRMRWLADDEPDARRRSGPAVGVRVVAQHDQAARAAEGDHRGRRALAEAAQVLAEACLDRAGRSPLRGAG